jgi:hypothetical protein
MGALSESERLRLAAVLIMKPASFCPLLEGICWGMVAAQLDLRFGPALARAAVQFKDSSLSGFPLQQLAGAVKGFVKRGF